MTENIAREQAIVLIERAQRLQMQGQFADAIVLYKRSLDLFPTAEAWTFLGWTYSMMERYAEAIAVCQKAIELDPTFGNPYNDIGAYLIELNQWEEAIPWLVKATKAPRYEVPQFPHLNLGRVYEHLGQYRTALRYFEQALAIDPFYRPASVAKYQLLGRLN
ncbi:MAG: tetratricopeptide repeat protein [Chloroflexi bacterium]|nr:tetratricopeptide repeat protein [Chloroflexota bacterium]MBP8054559.1 tetratricopeptide repeat protein [Chloroflexota bacterium]